MPIPGPVGSGRASGGASSAQRASGQQGCNGEQVVGEHGGADQEFEALAAFCQATLHPASPKQDRNAPLDSRAEALAFLERRALLVALACRGLLAAALRHGDHLDPGALASQDVLLAEKPAVATV